MADVVKTKKSGTKKTTKKIITTTEIETTNDGGLVQSKVESMIDNENKENVIGYGTGGRGADEDRSP